MGFPWIDTTLAAWAAAAFAAGLLLGIGPTLGARGGQRKVREEAEREKYLLEAQLRSKLGEIKNLGARVDELSAFALNFPQKVQDLSDATGPAKLTRHVVRACIDMLKVRSVQVFLLDDSSDEVVLAQCLVDGVEHRDLVGKRIPAAELPQRVVLEQRTVRGASAWAVTNPEMGVQPAIEIEGKRFSLELTAPFRTQRGALGFVNLSAMPLGETKRPEEVLGCLAQVAGTTLENLKNIDQAREQAKLDLMTQLLNHTSFKTALADRLQRDRGRGTPVAIFLFDLDHFKHYNDNNGHPAGDTLLKAISAQFKAQLRPEDVVGRYGGEEFVAMLPGCDKPTALRVADRIRKGIAEREFPNGERQPLGRVTISGGVAAFPQDALDSEHLIKCADRALYQSKADGRNRIAMFDSSNLEDELGGHG